MSSAVHLILFAVIALLVNACATGKKPCHEGGDVSWQSEIKGDRVCFQKKMPDGSYVNHGTYKVMNASGQVLLEGEFVDGEKAGYWIQYDEKGKKKVEKYFKNGVEVSPPAKDPKAE